MEAIGNLAGGIAHDFNNLLTAVNGYADLALATSRDGPVNDYLREIRLGGERAAELTRQLLAYSRKQVLQPKVVDLNQVVLDIQKILGRAIGEDIELRVDLSPEPLRVRADPGQIGQILLNLALNARDAMPHGGLVAIETTYMIVEKGFSMPQLEAPAGLCAVLSLADNGSGMTKETLARAFEPFFTTKEIGKGTGLGLSSVYGIVKQSGGGILAESEPGQGTRFRIFLPAHAEPPDEMQPAASAPAIGASKGPGGCILLVEDEASVLAFIRKVLEQDGYRVLACGSSEMAVRFMQDLAGEIDLLLTDMVLPGMNGKRLAKVFREQRAGGNILFMSGYVPAELRGQEMEPEDDFLPKPFTPRELLDRIRSVLTRHRAWPESNMP
jgi:CheY-like chemotaxis protein